MRALLVFKRQPKETRFLQDLCAGHIYIGAVLADVFDLPVSGVLAASGVIAIVPGLALQSTLGIAAELGQIMAIRQAAEKDRLSELDGLDPHGEHLALRLAAANPRCCAC